MIYLAMQQPFLMHAIFALAARHLRIQSDPTEDDGILESFHYQKALSMYRSNFIKNVHHDEDASLAASFIFTYYSLSLLDFKPSLDELSEDISFTFIQGIRTILHAGSFRAFGGPLGNLFDSGLHINSEIPVDGPGKCLLNLLRGLPTTSKFYLNRELYASCIYRLTGYLDSRMLQIIDRGFAEALAFCFFKWQALCPREFLELIRNNDEIALCILAHYYAAAASHLARVNMMWWWWRDKPAYMVETISEYLHEKQWEAWMEWPRRVLYI